MTFAPVGRRRAVLSAITTDHHNGPPRRTATTELDDVDVAVMGFAAAAARRTGPGLDLRAFPSSSMTRTSTLRANHWQEVTVARLSVFLSYSRDDVALASALAGDLDLAGLDVWRDEKLTGGQ
jgi:hypothetical protein